MEAYATGINGHMSYGEVYVNSSNKFVGKVFSLMEIAELSDRLWEIQCVITQIRDKRIAPDNRGEYG